MIKLYDDFLDTGVCPFCLERHLSLNRNETINENVGDFVRSLSIVVPTRGCVNDCKFCVSKMHKDNYDDISKEELFDDEYFKKMQYVKSKGGVFAILTGTGEPIQNKGFLRRVGKLNRQLDEPFIFEIQTSGVMLDDKNLNFLKDEVGVTTISLSVSDIFDDKSNTNTIGVVRKLKFSLEDICKRIKDKGFILRISINMIGIYDKYTPEQIINRLVELKPDQSIFRVLWCSGEDDEINRWIKGNSASKGIVDELNNYIKENGKYIGDLPTRYDVNGISIVIDDDCMARKKIQQFRYLILRQDCNLYTKWDSDVPYEMK